MCFDILLTTLLCHVLVSFCCNNNPQISGTLDGKCLFFTPGTSVTGPIRSSASHLYLRIQAEGAVFNGTWLSHGRGKRLDNAINLKTSLKTHILLTLTSNWPLKVTWPNLMSVVGGGCISSDVLELAHIGSWKLLVHLSFQHCV